MVTIAAWAAVRGIGKAAAFVMHSDVGYVGSRTGKDEVQDTSLDMGGCVVWVANAQFVALQDGANAEDNEIVCGMASVGNEVWPPDSGISCKDSICSGKALA